MKTKKYIKVNLILLSGFLVCASFAIASKALLEEPWPVPSAVKNMKNPTDPADKDGLYTGRSLYVQNCKSCHGKTGLGDGPNAKELKTSSGNFSTADFRTQTDGELFYKIREGRNDMPSFKKVIPEDENVWFVVNYIRSLK